MNEKVARTPVESPSEDGMQFYIPTAVSMQERRLRALKHNDTFALFDHYGDILAVPDMPDGVFHRDTRHLSQLELTINGQRPLLLSSTVHDDNAVFAVDLTNPDLVENGHLALSRDAIHVQRLKFLWDAACHERILLRNYDAQSRTVTLNIRIDGDFADLFEVRGQRRLARGERWTEQLSDRELALRCRGLDGVTRFTTVKFEPQPSRLDAHRASYRLVLPPGKRLAILIVIHCGSGEIPAERGRNFVAALRDARHALRKARRRAASVISSNSEFNALLSRSMSDLCMLTTDTPHGAYPYAGIPWFSTAFGRDGLITGLFTLWLDPSIACGVLKYLAATQATAIEPERDAEPGKILHETRSGEMARLGEVPFGRYYGTVDATPLFIALAGAYVERTDDFDTLRALWPNIQAALHWIDRYGDHDGDGFVEYNRHRETGLVNQGWKDSHDAVFHADGTLAQGPIALCEVQGYVYLAKRQAAKMARALGLEALSATLEDQAFELRERFEAAFWCEELSTYALALDGRKQPCRVPTSNAGHALFTGIASEAHAQRLAATLLDGEFFAGWGIRTVASSASRYNPMSYHNGSIWPHDNALIALGFARYGLKHEAQQLMAGMFDASTYVDLRRLPELLCGFTRQQRKGPTFYPVACVPQAWATTTPFALLQACLGLHLSHRSGEIRFDRPALPPFLDEVRLRGLNLGDATADIVIRRHAAEVAISVVRRRGDVRVVVVH